MTGLKTSSCRSKAVPIDNTGQFRRLEDCGHVCVWWLVGIVLGNFTSSTSPQLRNNELPATRQCFPGTYKIPLAQIDPRALRDGHVCKCKRYATSALLDTCLPTRLGRTPNLWSPNPKRSLWISIAPLSRQVHQAIVRNDGGNRTRTPYAVEFPLVRAFSN